MPKQALKKWLAEAKAKDSNVAQLIRLNGKIWTLQWVKGKLIARLKRRER